MVTIKPSKGYTMIELLIVLAIIGILAAVAIPQFSSYRTNSFNAVSESDMRNIQTGEEAYYADNNSYVNITAIEGYQGSLPGLPSVKLSELICASVTDATSSDYTAKVQHINGDTTYTASQTGNMVQTSKTAGIYDLGC
jgi:prepilin-type N-terminal cleavage/methylation domain-containing protein